jgi:hypothetical protein
MNPIFTAWANNTIHKSLLILLFIVVGQDVFATNSLRFYGNPTSDDHRVKIQVDDPTNSDPGPPADIGSEDFTLEFWMKAANGNNATAQDPCAEGWSSWIYGNVIFDRDRFNQGRAYGISIIDGVIWFGVDNNTQSHTICGSTNVLDGQWHHVVVQRRISDGWIQLYVDGSLEAEADGPNGDISYPDDGVPGNYCSGSCDFSDPYLVIGAEKHDADLNVYPSYSGFVDEVRLSNSIRYSGNTYSVPTQPFITDSNTMALYHFDEGSGSVANDTSGASGGPSNGDIRAGVDWSTDTPFSGGGTPVPGTIQFTETAASIDETGMTRSFTVTRTGGSGMVSVDYVIGDTGSTATFGADYDSTTQSVSGTLTWADGDTVSQTLTVDILDDTVALEGDETVVLTLSNPTGGASLGANTSATLTILDDEIPGTIQFTETAASISETGTGRSFTVTRSGGSGVVTVDYTIGGGATNPATENSDYQLTQQAASGTLTWVDGDTSTQTLTVDILDDVAPENDETVVLTLSNPTGGASLGGNTSATLTILDDDAPGTLQFASSYTAVNEGDGSATITVARNNGTSGVVTVEYSITGGTATANADYNSVQPASGILTFQNGQTSANITLTLLDDVEPESIETITFSLSNPSLATLGGRDSTTLGIVDNDSPPPDVADEIGAGAVNPLLFAMMLLLASVRHRRGTGNRP